jgi:hypothetical protein
MIRVRPRRRKARKSVQPIATELLMEPLFVWLKLDEPARSFRALKAFWDAAGDRLRLHARGERLRGSILMVRVRSAAWSQQLHLMKTQVLERVRASRGGAGVQDLRFTVGAVEVLPDWSAPPAPPDPPLRAPEPTPATVLDALVEVGDDELRGGLARLVEASARRAALR